MPTCTDFTAAPLLNDMSGALATRRIAAVPGMVLHEDGVRRLVLNTWYSDNGEVQNLLVVALSHYDAMGILKPWNRSMAVDWAQRCTITAESPQPSNRRWWLAVTLDDQGRYKNSNAFCDGHPCEMCAERATDPNLQTRKPCRRAHAHAWNQVGSWEDQSRIHGVHYVLGVLADNLAQARKTARGICERIATGGHL
ncbi:hypothetical protein [Streptomyces sp. S1D4-20]|uniref:hypothetical protein n=1 Tax=Streptomyces sp. S1D4-20 TaxID=2594462 RepID=UPI001161E7BB|nr:hypothetical protein [Streptomyces sp. S1D4-20]QDN54055.1 hypothetical protein FNV67_00300 [Streptomyces sp. S1D4-20]